MATPEKIYSEPITPVKKKEAYSEFRKTGDMKYVERIKRAEELTPAPYTRYTFRQPTAWKYNCFEPCGGEYGVFSFYMPKMNFNKYNFRYGEEYKVAIKERPDLKKYKWEVTVNIEIYGKESIDININDTVKCKDLKEVAKYVKLALDTCNSLIKGCKWYNIIPDMFNTERIISKTPQIINDLGIQYDLILDSER